MGKLLLTGCQWVDFYVYCKTDFHCERLRFEAEFCSEMKMKLDQYHFEYLLPKLRATGLSAQAVMCISSLNKVDYYYYYYGYNSQALEAKLENE